MELHQSSDRMRCSIRGKKAEAQRHTDKDTDTKVGEKEITSKH